MARCSQALNPTLKSVKDLKLVSMVIKCVQQLLQQEIKYFQQKKIEEMRIVVIQPLIQFVVQAISRSILNAPSNVQLMGYNLLPGLVSVIKLLKDTFRSYDT
jgi:hypothetical protein